MTRDDIFEVVRSNLMTIVDDVSAEQISEEASMSDLGADSLQVVEVLSRSMKDLKLRVPRTELSRASNLGELLNLFEEAAQAGP